ncbi:All-trans-phytoene synthase [Hyella patelloides LEGE 07179]|uniref:15-cis-phytoene synthase n=1 Tax=Hyella patelloides LEGE 07179 TaxID=945734 RepID=A0A563VYL7_9CYAN|nr:phytoene synthase [Hyella patelloides]VEP16519.1 All-trans-phytoene synthase [Hyella patelloides LEGE 07179]
MLQISRTKPKSNLIPVTEAYNYCRTITAEYAKTFYLGTLLMPKEKRKAIWAIYAWCRNTDELVDGAKAQYTTEDTLAEWERQLESTFAGLPSEDADVALADTVKRYPMDIQPFRDMIAGQQMDLYRNRYQTFEELKLYCYRVAGTVGLMSNAVLGINQGNSGVPWEKNTQPYNPEKEAVALGIAMQLTNILRDVGEDATRGRIYLPLDDLAAFDYTEKDLLAGVNDDRWKAIMRFQIKRARAYYQQAEKGISYLIRDSHLPVWTSLMLYQGILDAIEHNNYDVFNKRAFVKKPIKIASLPIAWLRAQVL